MTQGYTDAKRVVRIAANSEAQEASAILTTAATAFL
jgi:hypothetical protein